MAKKGGQASELRTCPQCGKPVPRDVAACSCGHVVEARSAQVDRLTGLKQNLMAEKVALEEKMQQLQRRLAAIQVLLEE